MIITKDFLTTENFDLARTGLKNIANEPVFRTSVFWPRNLVESFSGSIYIAKVPVLVYDRIYKEIKGKLVHDIDNYKVDILYQVWDKNSGISFHNDSNHEKALTIYLNDNWEWNNGGVFLYSDDSIKLNDVKAILPEKNKAVLVDNHERHMVTAISPYVEEPRKSIQVWFDKR